MTPDTPASRVLIIANPADRRRAHESLRQAGLDTLGAGTPDDALRLVHDPNAGIAAVVLHWPAALVGAVKDLVHPTAAAGLPSHVPLLVITDQEPEAAAALEAGAVDFAPLSELEDHTLATRLLARIHATHAKQAELAELGGGWTVDVARHRFSHPDGRSVTLAPQVFAAFYVLWQHRGEVVAVHDWLERAWGTQHVTSSAMHSTAAAIRKDLPTDCGWALRNERGVGYLLVAT